MIHAAHHKQGLKAFFQRTLKGDIKLEGVGVHSNRFTRILIKRSKNLGIVFIRTDLDEKPVIEASYHNISDTNFATSLTKNGITIQTPEHVLAGLSLMGITNAIIEVNGPEIPILDGSALAVFDAVRKVGVQQLNALYPAYYVPCVIEVNTPYGFAKLSPSSISHYHFVLDAPNRFGKAFGYQEASYSEDDPVDSLVQSRTFGSYEEGMLLKQKGFAQGANLDNTLVIQNGEIMNPLGMRTPNEMAMHKILDTIGDFSLFGRRIVGSFESRNGGHGLNHLLMQELAKKLKAQELKKEL